MSIWTRWLKLTPSASRTARRRSRKPSSQRRTGKVKVEQLEDRTLLSAAVWTNQSDYAPGSTAIIQGSGFQVGEAIRLEVLRSDGTPQGGSDNPWTITDGGQGDLDGVADGKFTTSWYVDPTYATNQTLNVTATGLTSGEAASATFTDAAVTISLTGGDVGSSTSDGVTSHNGSSAALSLTFSGTCQGGNRTIQLIEGTTVIASTSTSGGNWSITLNSPGTTLSDGVHNLVAHQTNGSFTDSTPLVVTIDTVAPTISGAATTSPNGAGWYTGDVTVHWTVSDALSGIAAPPADSTITGEGSNLSASATVLDKAGNSASATVSGIKIDRTPPATTVANIAGTQGSNGWYTGPVTVTLSATDNLSGVATTYYRVGGSGSYSVYDGNNKPVVSADGSTTVYFYSVDVAGNIEAAHTVSFQIDQTAPQVSMTGPAANSYTNNNKPTLTATASDGPSGIAGVQFQISSDNGASWANVGSPVTGSSPYSVQVASALADGAYQARAIATDNAGNSTTSAAVSFTVDTTAPSVTGVSDVPDPFSPNGDGVRDATAISYTVSEPSTVTLSVTDASNDLVRTLVNAQSQAAGSYSSAWDGKDGSGNVVADGTYTYNISATDAAGNSTNSATLQGTDHTVTVDNTAPTVSITAQPADPTNNNTASFTFSGSDNLTATANLVYQYSLDGVNYWTLPGNTLSLPNLADGRYTLSVRSIDEAGNTSAAASYSWTVDTTAPTTTASVSGTQGNNSWYTGPATVTLSASDANGSKAVAGVDQTYYRVDGGTQQTYSAPFTLSSDGQHTVVFWSVDRAGNEETPHQTLLVNIDQTAPTISGAPTTAANADGWYNANVTVTFTAADATSGVASVVPETATLINEGAGQSVTSTATDNAGNTNTATVSGINIDKTAPTTTAASDGQAYADAHGGWNNTDVTVTLTAGDSLSGIKATYYTLDAVQHTYTAPFTVSDEGTHTITYWSVDKAGNEETPHGSLTVNIDKTAPAITAGRNAGSEANGYGWNNADVVVHYTASDALSGLPTGTDSGSYTFTAEGAGQSYTFTVTDVAGNTASATVSGINIDKTPPTISGAPDRAANSYGWYNADVTVSFTVGDNLSGVASSSSPATLGEGANQSVTGTVTDLAGNTASATVSGINIDETAPTISASATTADAQPYVSGTWTNQDVTVHFTTSDALSGIASSPADVTLSGEGAGQSVSGTAYDKAGNSASATFSDIRIDKTAPASSISLAGTAGSNGWYVSNVTVTLSAVDQASLSGVAATEYRINGGAWTTYTAPFTLTDGVYTVDYRSTDHAGNVETFKSQQVKVDTVAPAVTLTPDRSADHNGWYNHAVSFTVGATDSGSGVVSQTSNFTYSGPDSATAEVSATATDEAGNSTTVSFDFQYDATAPVTTVALVSGPTKNASGWYTGAVTVTLSAADQAGLSGVAATYCTVDGGGQQAGTTVALTDDGVHTIQYWSVDAAGNVEAAHTLTVKIDQTAPAINAVRDLLAYAAAHGGWNNADVTASYTASDAASGLASPDSGSYVFSTEGAGQSHTFTVYDVAGNSASATVDQVNIDKTPPTVSITAPGSAAHYLLNQAVAAIYSSADALAGIASSAGTVANGANIDTSSVGSHSFAVTAADKAGNTTTQTVTYYVDYNYGTGLFAPVTAGKAFKLGSTIPVKFQLKDANGNYISNLSAVLAIQLDGSAATATGGTSLRYDPTAQQFVFNLSTAGVKTEGSHTITVVLASGQTISVPITLRNSAGAALLVGTGADSGSATDGQLLAGDMALVVDNGGGNFTADQMARVQAAVAGLNDLLAPYGARITIVDAGAGVPANIVLHLAATTVIGGMTEGVLGVTQDTGDITLVAGWDWYAGADAAAVGAGQFDFQTVITHELGHALGLGHSADAASVMYPTLAAGQARRDIGVADLNVADDGGGADGLHAALAPDMGAAAAAGHSPVTAPTPAGFPIAGPATGDLWVALSSQGTGFLAGTAWGDAVRPALGGNPPSAAGLPAWATDLAFAGRLGTTWAEGSGAGRARGWDADLFGATEGGEGNPGGAEGPADAAARDGFFTACSVGDNREGTAALAARESDGGPASARDE